MNSKYNQEILKILEKFDKKIVSFAEHLEKENLISLESVIRKLPEKLKKRFKEMLSSISRKKQSNQK